MFKICFQPDQGLITDPKQKEMNIHSSHARPKTKTNDQVVGIADYMGTSLEVNDNHAMHMYKKHMCHNKLPIIQQN